MSEPPTPGSHEAQPSSGDESEGGDSAQRLVAVLVIAVTLVGAVFAFLQTRASTRESVAGRRAQDATIEAMNLNIQGQRGIQRDAFAYDLSQDYDWLAFSYGLSGDGGGLASGYFRALQRVYQEAKRETARFSTVLATDKYKLPGGNVDFARFYEELYRPSYRAVQLQTAHGEERDGWSAKSSQLVTVITVLAVALFLLGLTLTVPAGVRRPLLWGGISVAVVAAAWGVLTWTSSVPEPNERAVDAYVEGLVTLNAADSATDYRDAIEHLSRAVELKDDYRDAYALRGAAYFDLDLQNPQGPQGSREALRDDRIAIELGEEESAVAWNNLGAAQFWLGMYEEGDASIARAMALDPDDLVINLNAAEGHKIQGREEPYRDQLQRVRTLLAGTPGFLRDSIVIRYLDAVDLAIRYRPEVASEERVFREDLLRILHEIEAANEQYGTAEPPEVDAEIGNLSFRLSTDRKEITVAFDYTGMEPDQLWSYVTYENRESVDEWTQPPIPWKFDTPDGGLVLTFTEPNGFKAGTVLRTELFVEANLLSAGEFTIP